MGEKADIIIRSNLIFSGLAEEELLDGFVGIKGKEICCIEKGNNYQEFLGNHTKIFDMTDKVVTPGFVDNHVFFMGYIWQQVGLDVSHITNERELFHALRSYGKTKEKGKPILAHDLPDEMSVNSYLLNESFADTPIVVFRKNREGCCMNQAAIERYGFDEENCYAEACYKLFRELVGDHKYAKKKYKEFQQMLAQKGITSIKEIGFDDYYGFTDVLKEMEEQGELMHRINLVSQPVGERINIEYGKQMQDKFQNKFVQFMGYNIMVDGDIETGAGDIFDKYPLEEGGVEEPDYETLERDVLLADKNKFRCALHAEGDRAVRKVIDIFEKCNQVNGERDARHAIIDMELVDPEDRKRLAIYHITAINYVQIMNCYPEYEHYYGRRYFSEERQKTIWPYRSLLKEGVNLCWGTDLPLDVPDIPLSIFFASERKFPNGEPENGYNKEEAINPAEVLQCWTYNGQKANFMEEQLGTLQVGKLADIAILDKNIFKEQGAELRKAEVCMTICDGKIVYQK